MLVVLGFLILLAVLTPLLGADSRDGSGSRSDWRTPGRPA